MSKDDNDGYDGNQDFGNDGNRGGGGGGGFPGGNLIGMLLPLLFRYPKLLIVVIILGGGFYLYNNNCSGAKGHAERPKSSHTYAAGCEMKREVYDSAEVFAALDPSSINLPEAVSLEKYCPTPMNQGQQGSCVGWGSTYNARTILEAVATGKDPNSIAFSPSFTYNQIGLEGCQGAYINNAMDELTQTGSIALAKFPYDENTCEKKPNQYELQDAAKYRMKGYARLTLKGDEYTIDVNAMRQCLANNAPVVIGMSVGGSFMQEMEGKATWVPTNSDYSKSGFGGHCMCVIAYDDFGGEDGKGAFMLANSWGPAWGKNGKAWVGYKDFAFFTNEAYAMYPLTSSVNQNKLSCSVALLKKDTKQVINLVDRGNNTFGTQTPLKVGDKFKMELTNNIECYIYVLGKELDNSCLTLFPYTPKHSSYCGVTGVRLFPRDYSFEVDSQGGNRDYMCVLISKIPLDYKKITSDVSAAKNPDFRASVLKVIGDNYAQGVNFSSNAKVSFQTEIKEGGIVPVFIEVDK